MTGAPSVASASIRKNTTGELVALGNVVARKKKREEAGDHALLVPRKRSPVGLSENSKEGPAVKKRVRAGLADVEDLKQIPPGSASHGGASEAPEPRTTSDKALGVKKKKKKVKKDGDEIDDIFG